MNQGLPEIIIPVEVLFNKNLENLDKITFGLIMNLSYNEYGCCWANDDHMAVILESRPEEISNSISRLHDEDYLIISHAKRRINGEIIRRIYINKKYKSIHEEKTKEKFKEIENFRNEINEMEE